MAKVEQIGHPVNESERKAIRFLRDNLPDDWQIFHNFEMSQGSEVFEIDIAILSPHAVYLVDVKGTRGNIDVYGNKWHPEGRQPFFSPLAKLRNHARILSTIIRESNTGLTELRKVHVQATVLLTDEHAVLIDNTGRESQDVTDLKRCINYFNDKSCIPHHRLTNITHYHSQVSRAICGKAKPRSSALTFRDWQVEEELGGDGRYTEYRAKHSLLGKSGGYVRLRVYKADPYQDDAARKMEFGKISNAYRAVAKLPSHANILTVKDLFRNDEEDKVILVTEDLPSQALRVHISKASQGLTFDQKLQVMRDVLSALDHAHRYEVIHRNLTPDAILITKGGQARITAFDYARVSKNRTSTIAEQIVEDLDENYQAPECYKDPTQASIASDIFSCGYIFYELLTGEIPFENIDKMWTADAKFPIKPSELKTDLPQGIDEWLQKFCEFDPEDRHPSAAIAHKLLDDLILPKDKKRSDSEAGNNNITPPSAPPLDNDLTDLPTDSILADRFRVQKKLGSGGFSVVYQVFDSYSDVVRVIKLITKDRSSVFERLRLEYKTLSSLPDHMHVVKVIWADRLTDEHHTPYIVFEYVEGLDVSDLIDNNSISLEDAVQIACQSAQGLSHLHKYKVYHQDIKPSNLLWTDKGVRIIDFNVAVNENDETKGKGGTKRYLPPDYDFYTEPDASTRVDRDLYALGITIYECMTGKYPFDETYPPIKTLPKNPKQFKGCSDLSTPLVQVLLKMIAPERNDRFASAEELYTSLTEIKRYRTVLTTSEIVGGYHAPAQLGFKTAKPNTNPFVTELLTLYSQSQISNAGTRGLDEIGKATYVSTYLDNKLKPALLKGEFGLVIISGNAGDGKTAFIQQFEEDAKKHGAQIQPEANGAVFKLRDHTYQSNYDGSQDQENERNDEVLKNFFGPYTGKDQSAWPQNQTRIIAINEGRLVDFFLEHEKEFPLLYQQVLKGLSGASTDDRISVINLNLRSIVADVPNQDGSNSSILEELIKKISATENWVACGSCDIKDKCYAYHNARTFQEPVASPKVIERLKMLYIITHLRGRLHITMRDLRSSLAFMMVGTRDCDGIHQLYQNGSEGNINQILNGFYFNSWLGGNDGSNDRLITLLHDIDIAEVSNPELDRQIGFLPPQTKSMSRFSFAERSGYDDKLLETLFNKLPYDYTSKNRSRLIDKHRNYLSHMRRRHFFERRDPGWKEMLPYHSIDTYMQAISQPGEKNAEDVKSILLAINRGEGLSDPTKLGNQLALRVRKVDKGTINSYRLFSGDHFKLITGMESADHPFLECLPQTLLLQYQSGDTHKASLRINLDIYEMLMRLNNGYQPSIEEQEGFYLSLSVFKNVLSAAPYQEVLLTENGFDFYKINRWQDGTLALARVSRSS